MEIVTFVPTAIVSPNPITIPTTAPDIDAVVAAEITRLPSALADHDPADVLAAIDAHAAAAIAAAIDDHPQADVVAALLDHPVHPHDLAVGAAAVAVPAGASAGGNDIVDGAGQVIPGGGVTGVQDNAAAQAHAPGAAAVPHVATAVPAAHAATVVAVAHAGGNPVVAAVPTKLTTRTISLNVNTLVGDLLTLSYIEVGERILAS